MVVKLLPIGGLNGARASASFMNEVGVWKELRHARILNLYGASHVGAQAFLMLEYADRRNLLSYLENPDHRPRFAELFYQAAQGLEYLHSKEIVHGHLRCCNILVSDQEGVVKLTDFGFDSVRSAVNALGGSNVANSIQWMAPEHFEMEEGGLAFDADVYALGMCMVEALVRGPPWGELDEMDVLDKILDKEIPPPPSDVPDDLWKLVVRILNERLALEQVIALLRELAVVKSGEK